MPGQCRFYPSCGDYCHQSLHKHGFLGGTILTIARIVRCHPYNMGGPDPVPEKLNWRNFIYQKDSSDETVG